MHILERAARTFEFFGSDCPPRIHLLDDHHAVDIDNFEYTLAGSDNPDFMKKILNVWRPIMAQVNRVLLIPMKELGLTNFEVTYLCAYRLWEVDRIEGLEEQTYRTAENVLKRIGEELHRYYVTDLKMKSYSGRVAEVMRLLNDVDGLIMFVHRMELQLDVCEVVGFEFHDSVFCRHRDE
uniref:NR LBD domain-containing protein n=1 Tax=Steinernema glaseri TaxID=37863 RepID=A0A1I8ANS0_9BILA